MIRLYKSLIAFFCSIIISSLSYSQHEISSFDEQAGILEIPNVVLRSKLFSLVRLQDDGNGMFDIIGAVRDKDATVIPPNASFIFLDSLTIVIPVMEKGDEYHYNQVYSISPKLKLSLKEVSLITDELLYQEGEITQIDSAVVIPSNLPDVKYKKSYSNLIDLPVNLIAPQCNLLPSAHVYPADWLGDLTLPDINGAPFNSDTRLAMGLKDIWFPTNPAFNENCEGDIQENFRQLIQTAVDMNIEYIEIFPWTLIDDRQPEWRIFNPEEVNTLLSASTIPDEDIAWIVEIAHEAGIEVYWRNQIQGVSDYSNPAETEDNMNNFLSAYEDFVLERAEFLESIGIDGMQFDCTCWFEYWVDNEITQIYFNGLDSLVPQIRNIFSGTLFNESQTTYLQYENISQLTDRVFIDIKSYLELTNEEQETLDVETIKNFYINSLEGIAAQFSSSYLQQVTFTFEIGADSRANFFEERGYVETAAGCNEGIDPETEQSVDCVQDVLTPDFALQARVLEGQLEAIKEQTAFPNYEVATNSFWLTPQLASDTTYPSLDNSIRSKPAEKIIQIWFDK